MALLDVIYTTAPQAELNIITNTRGLLTKEFSLVDGVISKVSHGDLYQGTIENKTVTLHQLQILIEGLDTNQALNLGALKPEFEGIAKLTTLGKVVAGASIARSKTHLEFQPKPTFMLLDYDNKDFTQTGLHAILLKEIPEFEGVGMLWGKSSSAGIYQSNDAPPTEIKSGSHTYLIVTDGATIPEIGKFIKYRMWKAGYGYIQISANGALLERQLFDDAVHTPERLVFEATPIKGDGLTQVPRQFIRIEGGALSGDFKISPEQEKELKKLIDLAKTTIRPEAGRVAKAYDKLETKKLVDTGITQAKATKIIEKRRNGILNDTHELKGVMWGIVHVGAVLANPEAYHSESFIDPLETHSSTTYRAKLMQCEKSATDKTKVWKIRSYAHGGTFYELEATRAAELILVQLDQPITDFVEFAPHTKQVGKESVLLTTLENLKALATCYGISFEYDVIRREKLIKFPADRKTGDLSNDANLHKLRNLCVINGLNPNVTEGINEIFFENEVNNVTDFIKATQWDGVPRIEALFQTLTLANQSDYVYGFNILKMWLIQCVAAADRAQSTPLKTARAKYENVFILAGVQGGNKTDWLERLTGLALRMYHDKGVQLTLDDKDSVFEATSFWIVELGELDATFRKSDISALKAFLSRSYELMRRPYDKVANQYQRRTSYCATVNNSNFLHDVTGNRRYLPLEITHCDKHHTVDMAQVWAEVWGLYIRGEKWWFDATDEIAVEVLSHQRGAMHHDPIIEEFIQWNGGEPDPLASDTTPFRRFTVKQLVEQIRPVVTINGFKGECKVSNRDLATLRAYLNERGFKATKSDGVMKYKITTIHDAKKYLSEAPQREVSEKEIEAIWGSNS
jgi:hypothetical protein